MVSQIDEAALPTLSVICDNVAKERQKIKQWLRQSHIWEILQIVILSL